MITNMKLTAVKQFLKEPLTFSEIRTAIHIIGVTHFQVWLDQVQYDEIWRVFDLDTCLWQCKLSNSLTIAILDKLQRLHENLALTLALLRSSLDVFLASLNSNHSSASSFDFLAF